MSELRAEGEATASDLTAWGIGEVKLHACLTLHSFHIYVRVSACSVCA